MADRDDNKKRTSRRLLSILLTLAMVAAALVWGAYQGWKGELRLVESSLAQVEERLKLRLETSQNILTVARRHLPGSEPALRSLREDAEAISAKGSLPDRAKAAQNARTHALQLLKLLEGTPSVKEDSRDSMYVLQLLPQQLEQSAAGGWQEEYNLRADGYNQGLKGSFSGWLARLVGVKPAERLDLGVE